MQIARILWSLEVRIATGRTGWFDRGNHRKYSYQARCDHVCQTFAQTPRHDLHNHLHCTTSKFPDAIQRRKIAQRDSTRNQLQNIFSRKGSLKFNHSYLSFKIGKRILRIKLNFDCIFLFYLIGESLRFKYKLCEESTEEGPFRKKNARLTSNSGHWVLLKKNLHLVSFSSGGDLQWWSCSVGEDAKRSGPGDGLHRSLVHRLRGVVGGLPQLLGAAANETRRGGILDLVPRLHQNLHSYGSDPLGQRHQQRRAQFAQQKHLADEAISGQLAERRLCRRVQEQPGHFSHKPATPSASERDGGGGGLAQSA